MKKILTTLSYTLSLGFTLFLLSTNIYAQHEITHVFHDSVQSTTKDFSYHEPVVNFHDSKNKNLENPSIEWIAFYSHVKNNTITLHWETQHLERNTTFSIEHSLDGHQWNHLENIHHPSHHHSNHHGHHHYHFETPQLESGHHYFRIKHISKLHHDKTISPVLELDLIEDKKHKIISALPNHLHSELHLAITLEKDQTVTIHFLDKNENEKKTVFTGNLVDHITHHLMYDVKELKHIDSIMIEGEFFQHHFHLASIHE